MILSSLGGLITFLGGLIIMLLIVPRDNIRSLLSVGLIGGFGVALLLLYFMQNLFGFWVFYRVDFFNILDIPIILSATWIPLVITFSYLSSNYTNLIPIVGFIIAFPVASVLVHLLFIVNGMLFYNNWNLMLTFILSLIIHIGIAIYLYANGLLKKTRNVKA